VRKMGRKTYVRLLGDFARDLPHMGAEELQIALERISRFGIERPTGPVRRPGVMCPFTQLQVVSPCSLSKCKYFIEDGWNRNCLLEYLEARSSDSLAVEEIAFLYKTTVDDVEATIAQGMLQLRDTSQETVGFSGDFEKSVPPEVLVNSGEEGGFKITPATLSPPFIEKVNTALEALILSDIVFQHPAIRILGVLDTIINEIE
jgi:hypothetical protein